MTPILTITLNPALDVSTSVPEVVPETKLRCAAPLTEPGGGGVNVARAIAHQGGRASALVALGGHNGARLRALLHLEGIDVVPFDTPGETRQSLAVTDESQGVQYRFVLPGPVWDDTLLARFRTRLSGSVPTGGLVVLSGSQPPGVPDTFPQTVARAVEMHEARLLVDTSGPSLMRLRQGGLGAHHILRLDGAESELLAGVPLPDRAALTGFAQSLVDDGVAGMVILAMGPKGSVLVSGKGAWHAVTPLVPVRSKVGAGDSFVGAFCLALSRQQSLPQALSMGVAAASAAVMSDGTALCLRDDVEELLGQVTLTQL